MIASIDEKLKAKGDDNGVNWETYIFNMEQNLSIPRASSEQFLGGLRLDKTNKMELLDLACKPYKLDRYLYKPLLIWEVDGKEYSFLGINAWTEAILQYATNAIPWGKAPQEWMKNACFKKYVHDKEDSHGDWLENSLEEIIKDLKFPYDRNVKNLTHVKGSTNIDVEGLGEVDFIVASKHTKRIYIIDCKHLLSRYDMANQRNDFNAFVKNKKSYNETMSKKVEWFQDNKELLIEHILEKDDSQSSEINNYNIEGIFIINTPTIYMYNSEFRIYTISQIKDVFLDKHKDIDFVIVEDEENKAYRIGYPYFEIPDELTFELIEND